MDTHITLDTALDRCSQCLREADAIERDAYLAEMAAAAECARLLDELIGALDLDPEAADQ